MAADACHRGLMGSCKDKYRLNSCGSRAQWLGWLHLPQYRGWFGAFLTVEWGNAPLSPRDLWAAPKNLENCWKNCQQQTNQGVSRQVLKKGASLLQNRHSQRIFLRGLKGGTGSNGGGPSWKPSGSAGFNASCSTARPEIAG